MNDVNRVRAYDTLKLARSISRAQLARQTGLSRTAVTGIAEDLLRVGVAEEVGSGASTGGRPPVLLQFNPNAAVALGARMRNHEWGIVASNLDGEIRCRLRQSIPGNTPEEAVAALCRGVATAKTYIDTDKLLPAIGLGTPGLVDMESGVIKTAVDVGWFDVPIRTMVEDALGMDVFVANRSRVGALAEFLYGIDKGVKNLIYISIGTGVVAGIVHRGELYQGANSSAGELGHVTIIPDGPLCPCGNRGCLQQLVSGPAIVTRTRQLLRTGQDSHLIDLVDGNLERITAEMVFAAAENDDSLAQQVVAEIADYLGIATANLVNLFNPELIIVGGPLGHAGRVLLEPLRNTVQNRAMIYPLSAVQIIGSSLGEDTGAIGAAALVVQQAPWYLFRNA